MNLVITGGRLILLALVATFGTATTPEARQLFGGVAACPNMCTIVGAYSVAAGEYRFLDVNGQPTTTPPTMCYCTTCSTGTCTFRALAGTGGTYYTCSCSGGQPCLSSWFVDEFGEIYLSCNESHNRCPGTPTITCREKIGGSIPTQSQYTERWCECQ